MTQMQGRGMPRRPRPSRTDGAQTLDLLLRWAGTVRHVERGIPPDAIGCPVCDGIDGLEARDVLEAVIRRGGRRGRRVAAAVQPLDDRFARATTPSVSGPSDGGWWRRRNLD
ncbi:hypothetical protein ACFUMH_07940 [Cellulomonas sp. NPDC057328]|uniref:hypothetical protein n=1 Tax=Cellulomonas sp. NPDC057328 TaxID=3346101 RepID=UPI00363B4B26